MKLGGPSETDPKIGHETPECDDDGDQRNDSSLSQFKSEGTTEKQHNPVRETSKGFVWPWSNVEDHQLQEKEPTQSHLMHTALRDCDHLDEGSTFVTNYDAPIGTITFETKPSNEIPSQGVTDGPVSFLMRRIQSMGRLTAFGIHESVTRTRHQQNTNEDRDDFNYDYDDEDHAMNYLDGVRHHHHLPQSDPLHAMGHRDGEADDVSTLSNPSVKLSQYSQEGYIMARSAALERQKLRRSRNRRRRMTFLAVFCAGLCVISSLAAGALMVIDRRGDDQSNKQTVNNFPIEAPSTSSPPGPSASLRYNETECDDDDNEAKFDFAGDEGNCTTIQELPEDYRESHCSIRPDIFDACPRSCGTCRSTKSGAVSPLIVDSFSSSPVGVPENPTASPSIVKQITGETNEPTRFTSTHSPTVTMITTPTGVPALVATPTTTTTPELSSTQPPVVSPNTVP